MTETRAELVDRGYLPNGIIWPEDIRIVQEMHCPQCGAKPTLTSWRKPGQWTKMFTRCLQCGYRRPF